MINQYVIDALIEDADDSARMLVKARTLGEVTEDGMVREIATLESAESSCRTLAEVGRLLNSDEKFRDALGEARGRKADADMQRAEAASDSGEAPIQCGECGERAEIMHYGKYLCIPCYEIANAAQFGPTDPQEQAAAMQDEPDAHALLVEAILNDPSGVGGEDEPDLAPSDAQDDEAGEVTL